MQKRTTYLIGAGASINSLPVLNDMVARMKEQIIYINDKAININNILNDDKIPTKEEDEYITDLKWLIMSTEDHATVDTFAKKLYLTSRTQDLDKLKNCLAVFLTIEQLKNAVDPRYDTFFASMLNKKLEMSDDINIVSWNYDMQFEMAYQSFKQEFNLDAAQDSLRVSSKHKSNWVSQENKFGIYKLNGSSFVYTNDNAKRAAVYAQLNSKRISIPILQEIFSSYSTIKRVGVGYTLGISFSWENEHVEMGKDIVSIAQEQTAATEILVIIGYSIPYFNRKADRDIIQKMTKLKKVYFQSPDATAVIERFSSIRNDIEAFNLIPIFNCDQFYIPNEL